MSTVLADVVLFLHVAYAAFVLGGFVAILLGLACHWSWVRARSFRLPHLLCTGIVAVEALIGLTCPLTWLENMLLIAAGAPGYDRSFVGHILYWLLYYDAPAWVFMVAYAALAFVVLTLYYYMPSVPKAHRQRG